MGGLGCDGFFIHSNGDLAGWGREERGGEGGQSSSRLDPMLILGGAPAETEGLELGRPRSVVDDGWPGSVL